MVIAITSYTTSYLSYKSKDTLSDKTHHKLKIYGKHLVIKNCDIECLELRAPEVTIIDCKINNLYLDKVRRVRMTNVTGHHIEYQFSKYCQILHYENIAFDMHVFDESPIKDLITEDTIKTACIEETGYIPYAVRKLWIMRHGCAKITFDMICQLSGCPFLEELTLSYFNHNWLHILTRLPRIKHIYVEVDDEYLYKDINLGDVTIHHITAPLMF